MKLAILSRNKQLFSIRRLLKEARAMRVECEVFDPLDCQIVVRHDLNTLFVRDRILDDVDVVIPRIGASITEYGLAVVRQLEAMRIPVINPSFAIAQSRDKLHCLQVLAKKGFQVPNTVLMRGTKWFRSALRWVHGTPAVVKLLEGTQGVGVMIVESPTSAESVLDAMWRLEQDVILQQFISESAGRDIRAFVIGDKVVAAMRRSAKDGDFRSNIHRGGEGEIIHLKEPFKKAAIGAAKAVGLTVAGVDMLESLTGPRIIEINSSPGFEGIEAATGMNIAKLIIQHCTKFARSARRGRKSK
ncbi:MAG: RimK family alpha-L-glutamate ligase [Bacteriovoracia bacterium]